MRTRTKFCGITRPEDARFAASLGVDAIGLVFYPPSPRAVTPAQAREIVAVLPPFVTSVALFVDAAPEWIEEVIKEVAPDLLQFHGTESPEACAAYGRPYFKAIRMAPDVDLVDEAGRYASAQGLLLDTYREGVAGGTGEAFDWGRIPGKGVGLPLILAGGLDADNVAAAIEQVRPYGVDVSGGIEAEKGIKSPDKMTAFMQGVERGDRGG